MLKTIIRILMFLFTFTFIFPKEIINIGIIYDSPVYYEGRKKVLVEELERSFEGSNYEERVLEEHLVKGEEEFYKKIEEMEADPSVDVIVALGLMVSELSSGNPQGYDKLTVAPFGISSGEVNIKNLSYVSKSEDIRGDISTVEEIREIEKIGFLIPGVYTGAILRNRMKKIYKSLEIEGYEVSQLIIGEDETKLHKEIKELDMLYILDIGEGDIESILDKAIEEKVVTFSRVSRSKYSDKMLFSYKLEEELESRTRAATMSLIRSLEGDAPNEILTNLGKVSVALNYNLTLSEKVGVYPDYLFAQRLDFVDKPDKEGISLGFEEGIRLAVNENLDLKSHYEDIETSRYNTLLAKSEKRPEVNLFSDYKVIDKDSGERSTTSGENSVRGGASLNYIIYDDELSSIVDKNEYQRLIDEAEYEQEKLDIIRIFSTSYLNILELNEKVDLEQYNYNLMKEYLQIAETKFEVGSSGPEDIYRFQSEIANALTNLSNVESQVRLEEASLSEVLNNQMATNYHLSEIGPEDKAFRGMNKLFEVSNVMNSSEIQNIFIREGKLKSPEIAAMDASIDSKNRELKSAYRERYSPKVSINGEWSDNIVDDWGAGSSGIADEDRWSVGARVELPIYKGGGITYTQDRVKSEIKSLEAQKLSLENNIEKKISQAFIDVLNNFISTTTTKEARNAAKKNLDLASEFYAKGNYSVSDLLDSRTNSVEANRGEITARYSYLRSIVELERNMGEYMILMDDLERDLKLEKMQNKFGKNKEERI